MKKDKTRLICFPLNSKFVKSESMFTLAALLYESERPIQQICCNCNLDNNLKARKAHGKLNVWARHSLNIDAEIVKTTLVVSLFRFLRVGSRISVVRGIFLLGMQILKVGSWISD